MKCDSVAKILFSCLLERAERGGISRRSIAEPAATASYSALGSADPTLANFSISHDTAYITPILQQALQLNPATTVMATPWSPPGWMKSSGSTWIAVNWP